MGLFAFCAFVLPWALIALWLFRLPSALRANLPPTPWRPLTDYAAPGDAARSEPAAGPSAGPSNPGPSNPGPTTVADTGAGLREPGRLPG